jgi:hypothetical protein
MERFQAGKPGTMPRQAEIALALQGGDDKDAIADICGDL